MKQKHQILINTVGNTVYLFSLWLLTVVTTKVLGYDAAGTLTLSMAIGNVVASIQMYGVRGYQASDVCYRYSSIEYVLARFITVIAGWIIGIVYCFILGYPFDVCVTIMLFILLKSSESFSDALFGNEQRAGHLEYAGVSMFIRGILVSTIFTICEVASGSLNAALLFACAGVHALTLFGDLPKHNRAIVDSRRATITEINEILKVCFPLSITVLLPIIITAIPRVILDHYYGAKVLGYYGNVSTPALLLSTIVPTILTAFLPNYGKAFNEKNFRHIYNIWINTILGVILLTLLSLFGVLLGGRFILTHVYTNEIEPYVHYLYYILFAMMLSAIVACNNTLLIAIRKNWGITLIMIISLCICLALAIPMIKSIGIYGTIAVLAISYGFQAVIQVVWIVLICRDGEKQ